MTLNEYMKLHPPSIATTSLIKELKQYSQEDDYIIGILLDCESDAKKQHLLDYIRQGKDVSYESIILCALEIAQNTMIDSIKQYDNVILKDGRKASIVEILGDKEAFIADIDIGDDYETETIYPDEIDEIENERKPNFIIAHDHSKNNRQEISQSEKCGCFYCLAVFMPESIKKWTDDETQASTALCPYCGVDSVIGDNSGFEITEKQLEQMHKYWFEPK